MRFFIYLCFALILPIACGSTWRRTGIGRVVHAFSHESGIIVVSELGIIAHLNGDDGSIKWRSAPPPHGVRLLSVDIAPKTSRGTLVLFTASDEKVTAYVIGETKPLWQRHACNLRSCNEPSGLVDMCDGRTLSIDIATGEVKSLTEGQQGACSSKETNAWTSEDAVWSADTHISMELGQVRSFTDGRLTLSRGNKVIWLREEGLSHIAESALYTPENGNSRSSVLVARSEFGVVYGLDAGSSGQVLWKCSLENKCRLVTGHSDLAVVVCGNDATSVRAFRVQNGDLVLQETIEGFVAVQVLIERTRCRDKDQVYVRMLSSEGEEITSSSSSGRSVSERTQDRGWLSLDATRSEVRGLRNGVKTWRVVVPTDSTIVKVEAGKPFHPASSRIRAPAIRVTGDRRVLFRHVDQEVVLVLSENKKESLVHAMLVDAKAGSLLETITHPEAGDPVCTTRGESWFVYTFWNNVMLEQEIHVIDMYEPDEEVTRVHHALHEAANSTLGSRVTGALKLLKKDEVVQCPATLIEESEQGQCMSQNAQTQSDAPKRPIILRSSMLIAKRITGLDVTETTLGLIEPSIAITLEASQVVLVSRILLDARRPKNPSKFSSSEYLIPYRPLLNLRSASPEAKYVSFGEAVLGLKHVAIAPVNGRESLCQFALVGTDILYTQEHPVGSFDVLSEDFSYASVLGMLFTLGGALFYTTTLKKKARLSKSW
ncbi:unnamed protein product [Chondrus crispus]|uniref:ER membrane protein complex subunit 1 n=1 Tax=Chondrus crispus TaxID=2769 RepID=R7QDA6_CHOCR|nr:unnamed protein product [Chondrus crispus]CDF36044.1 unnamed protein product [Chondrus crispus]|eukprot:XP_005715863.1 unnamed protein product [Chondrus crispus]